MNNPVHTTPDGRQLQRTFYTPYFMDAFTGRNSKNYNSYYQPISEGMANVGNFFGRYNLYLDMAKPPSENEQSWIDTANKHIWDTSTGDYISTLPSEEFKSNMPILNPEAIDGGVKMWGYYSDPVYEEIYNSINNANNKSQRQPSRLDYFPAVRDNATKYYLSDKKQKDIEM